ncbi:transglutaminase superfamily protein [Murinocardiopsis flavida]|uniref:Transglutaminase superfamily protein n=1 Tax=Murinocardiopsis flavida TaxID=645275 RepID=A0A2P8DHX2_9ACTN|nr:transglutaminaseTgpA domain-containing protein [Murinocardiopsis flavida]PSK96817.1 transglutaminase superfamily protein [Murinocardiopsis flavida]
MRFRITIAVVVATLCGISLLDPLFATEGWWSGAAIAVAAVAATGLAGRAARLPSLLLPPAQAVVALCAVTAMYAGDTAPLGFVPAPEAIDRLRVLAEAGRTAINLSPTPVEMSAGIGLVLALSIALFAIVADVVAVTLRAPALMGLAVLALLVVPLAVHQDGVQWPAFAAAAGGYLLLLAVDGWERTTAWGRGSAADRSDSASLHLLGAARIAIPAVAVALLAPLAVPGLASDAVFDLASGVRAGGETITTTHPMVTLRRDLASGTNRRVMYYNTTTETPDYLRMYVLDGFDGQDWTMAPLQAADRNRVRAGQELPQPEGQWLDDAPSDVTSEITLTTGSRRMAFLPAPYPAREMTVTGDWFVDPETLMAFSPTQQGAGLTYTVRSTPAAATRADLAGGDFPADGQVDDRYLALPDDVDPRVAELTESITGDAADPHEAAVALQDWFTDGRFTYDLRPPVLAEGEDPLTDFLFDTRTGYCEQFAASMAVMARQAGIPARVAVGYTPGERNGDRWVVTERNAHAWPELYFQGFGWLRFEPTPSSADGQGTAVVPSYASEAAAARPDTDTGTAAPNADDLAERQSPDTGESAAPAERDPAAGADSAGGARPDPNPLPALLTGAALVLALSAPALTRLLVRRFRWARAATPRDRANAAWRELRDDLTDLEIGWSGAETARALAQRVAAEQRLTGPARESLERIARARERALYAPDAPETGPSAADSRTVRAALRAAAERRVRVRAAVLPVSILRRPAPAAAPGPTRA